MHQFLWLSLPFLWQFGVQTKLRSKSPHQLLIRIRIRQRNWDHDGGSTSRVNTMNIGKGVDFSLASCVRFMPGKKAPKFAKLPQVKYKGECCAIDHFCFVIYPTQCCGSRMNYSGSSYELLRFRIQTILFKHFWKLLKKHLNFNKVENLPVPTICQFLQSYSPHTPEFTGLKLDIKVWFIYSFLISWTRFHGSPTLLWRTEVFSLFKYFHFSGPSCFSQCGTGASCFFNADPA